MKAQKKNGHSKILKKNEVTKKRVLKILKNGG